MMRLRVIGTGSSGNSYLVSDNNDNVLILDAGIRAKRIFAEIDDNANVCGCLVTHEHNDHSRAVFDLALRGVRIGASDGTINAIGAGKTINVESLKALQTYAYGVYTVMPFKVQHDAAEPFGFLVRHRETKETLLYATDTYYLRNTFPGVMYWMIECNYVDADSLRGLEMNRRLRLMQSHMSLERLKQTLAANDLRQTMKIVLVHLSDSNSDEERMISEIEKLTGIETIAARAGMEISLSENPF